MSQADGPVTLSSEPRRDRVLDALIQACTQHPDVEILWLQGSLARGDADAQSDIDAYVAVEDGVLAAFTAGREGFLRRLGNLLIWNDLRLPGAHCVHALYDDGVRLDLFIEPGSKVGDAARPPFHVLVDRNGAAARLRGGWRPPVPEIARAISTIIRFTRQGATWPARLLGRGQWSTFAMAELDLVNQQLAQLMAVQADAADFYQHPLAVARRLQSGHRAELDRLTARILVASQRRDLQLALDVHLAVFDAHVREARSACRALETPYPVPEDDEAKLRTLIETTWPSQGAAPSPVDHNTGAA